MFTSDHGMDQEVDKWIGILSAVMQALLWMVVVKKESSKKVKQFMDLLKYLKQTQNAAKEC